MSIDGFWRIVDGVHTAAPNSMEAKCRILKDELRKRPLEELRPFARHFSECYARAYSWDLWAAAFIIAEGCGDDGFIDFRSSLISLGRETFEKALLDPDSLADLTIDPEWAVFEGYQYVAGRIHEEAIGKAIPSYCHACQPAEPMGTRFVEWELSSRLPKLAAKHGHKDSDWHQERDRQEKEKSRREQAARLVELMFASGVILQSGLFPPFRVVASVMRSGTAPAGAGRECKWEPFDLEQDVYWTAVVMLENLTPEDLRGRPLLAVGKLRHDVSPSDTGEFASWRQGKE